MTFAVLLAKAGFQLTLGVTGVMSRGFSTSNLDCSLCVSLSEFCVIKERGQDTGTINNHLSVYSEIDLPIVPLLHTSSSFIILC